MTGAAVLVGLLEAIIDREADSVSHYRDWDRRGHWFVVRADDHRQVRVLGRDAVATHTYLRVCGW